MTYLETKYYYDNYYKNGISTFELGKKFNHSHHYYLDSFKKYGFDIRSNKINSRRYYANFDYFENIDSDEKAYWLGYMYADGYISNAKNNGKKVGMALSIKDKQQLAKFKKSLNSTYPINTYKQTSSYSNDIVYCRMIITSDKMFDDLVNHGVVEHKTQILKAPDIDSKFYNSFILGYFDGDGSIFLNNSRSPFYSINIVGTDDMLTFIHNQFVLNGVTQKELNLEKRKDDQKVSYIRYGGNGVVRKIYNYLYKNIDHDIPLQRKLDLFLNCCRNLNSRVS